MARATKKITLNAGRDIPFNKFVLSQQNVRKTKAGISIEELAEDIRLISSVRMAAGASAAGRALRSARRLLSRAPAVFRSASAVTAIS